MTAEFERAADATVEAIKLIMHPNFPRCVSCNVPLEEHVDPDGPHPTTCAARGETRFGSFVPECVA